MIFFLFFFTSLSFGAEVFNVGVTLRHILVTQDLEKAFEVGDYLCVVQKSEEVACGFVEKADGHGVLVDLEFRAEDVKGGSKVQRALTRRPCDPNFKFRPLQDPRMEKPLQDPYSRACTPKEKETAKAFKVATTRFFSVGTGIVSPRIAAEFALADWFSIGASIELVTFYSSLPTIRSSTSGVAYGGDIFFGIYPMSILEKFYFQLSLGHKRGRLSVRDELNSWSGTVVGLRAGYRFMDWESFGVGIALGGHHYALKNPEDSSRSEFLHPNILIEFGGGF